MKRSIRIQFEGPGLPDLILLTAKGGVRVVGPCGAMSARIYTREALCESLTWMIVDPYNAGFALESEFDAQYAWVRFALRGIRGLWLEE